MSDDSDDDSLEFNETYLHYTFDVRFVRLVDRTFLPAKMNVRAEIMFDEDAADFEIELAFSKIRYWLDNFVSRSIVFRRENDYARAILIDENGMNRTGNFIMLTPSEPTDEHLAVLFQAKMAAIATGTVGFGPLEVKSDGPTGISVMFAGDAMERLPTMEEWVGDGANYFETPWWTRADTSMLDIQQVPEGADLTRRPSWASGFEMFDALLQNEDSEPVVLRPTFKPTVVDGGETVEGGDTEE